MSGPGVSILGAGCVTALGRGWETVWKIIRAGAQAERTSLQGPNGLPPVDVFKTPLPDIPPACAARLRRSSAISYFSCAAAADAVQQAGPLPWGRTAVVFAASNGAVVYTRRFFEEVVDRGTGSPLLFPETVYNAPASHVAAMLGLDGPVLTLVSDATVGMDALSTAADLIFSGDADRCLVVAAEELDWIACEAYRRWKLAGSMHGSVLSEGAIALVLGPSSDEEIQIARIHPGRTIRRSVDAASALRQVIGELTLGDIPDLAVLSASGGRAGLLEESVLKEIFPETKLNSPKLVTGEAFAASTLLQCLCAWQEIRESRSRKVLVPIMGWGGQAGGALLVAPASGI